MTGAAGGAGRSNVRVQSMAWEAEGVLSLILQSLNGAALPTWTPGSHIDFEPAPGLVAQYSLCGPAGASEWMIAVLLQKDGKGVSRFIHERLRPGAIVAVSGPRNHFELTEAPSHLFIAGGIGITPFLPMMEKLDVDGSPWRLVYGGRSRSRMAFAGRLAHKRTNVQLFAQDEAGLIPLGSILDGVASGCAIYCCGPEPLIAAVETWLKDHGFAPPLVERFSPKSPGVQASRPFSLTLARSGMTLEVPADRSIADVLDASNVFVPTSCREGVCGSCETRVLAGEIDHRDSILSPQEMASGQTMMICISRAAGQSITLDL